MPQRSAHDFSGYRDFTNTLRELADAPHFDADWNSRVTASLDGVAGSELRRLVDLPARRAFGAFFTGSVLAETLLGELRLQSDRHFIYDPTVGAADLLGNSLWPWKTISSCVSHMTSPPTLAAP
ncbi:MAG: hypothetical protein L0Z50_42885 [Verrucomicrobiales bacterium]|nr:hypothetical protein [Verrucomicrobiales bacterium]